MYFFFFRLEDWIERALDAEAERLRKAGKPANRTDVIRSAGLNQDTVYRMLRGKGPFSRKTINAVAEKLHHPPPRIELTVVEQATGEAAQLALVREIRDKLAQLEELIATQEPDRRAATGSVARRALPQALQQDLADMETQQREAWTAFLFGDEQPDAS